MCFVCKGHRWMRLVWSRLTSVHKRLWWTPLRRRVHKNGWSVRRRLQQEQLEEHRRWLQRVQVQACMHSWQQGLQNRHSSLQQVVHRYSLVPRSLQVHMPRRSSSLLLLAGTCFENSTGSRMGPAVRYSLYKSTTAAVAAVADSHTGHKRLPVVVAAGAGGRYLSVVVRQQWVLALGHEKTGAVHD